MNCPGTLTGPWGRRLGGLLLIAVCSAATIGCTQSKYTLSEARQWSSQRSWDTIENNDPNLIERVFSLFPEDMAQIAESADSSFATDAREASKTTPPGGLKLLLDQVRVSFLPTIVNATQGLTDGASGIIVLGDFIGPDGRPLADDVAAQIDVENFLDELQTSDGVAGNWFIIALSPEDMKDVLEEAGATPGEAVKVGIYEFVYDPQNIYYMELSVSSTPYDPQHMITYTGNARMSQVQTRTKVPGRGNGEVKFFYQPFMKDWIELTDENQRRLRDAKELAAERAASEKSRG